MCINVFFFVLFFFYKEIAISKSKACHMNPMCLIRVLELLSTIQGCLPCEQLLITVCAFSFNETVHKKGEKHTLPLDLTSAC